MPRPLRIDRPGFRHHVMNRGHSRRAIFETRFDIRLFLSLLARAVRAGRLEVLAFAVMITHYHLLVRSLDGEVWRHLQWVQDLFARFFNRTRGRRGAVFGGRFKSKRVQTARYERAVIFYIDQNPVKAGIVATPEAYPFGSAHSYVHRHGPRWLARRRVEGMACSMTCTDDFSADVYRSAFGGSGRDGVYAVVENALLSDGDPFRELDDLVGAAPAHVQRWLAENARNADGFAARAPIASASSICALLHEAKHSEPDRLLCLTRKSRPFWLVLEAGLLRQVCRLTLQAIAQQMGIGRATAREWIAAHCVAVDRGGGYAAHAAAVVSAAVEREFGWLVPNPDNLGQTPSGHPGC